MADYRDLSQAVDAADQTLQAAIDKIDDRDLQRSAAFWARVDARVQQWAETIEWMNQRAQNGTRMPSQWFEIRVKGHLTDQWITWLEGFTLVNTADGDTILSGPVADQAALSGVLNRVGNLGLMLVAVNRVEPPAATSERD